MSLLSSGVLLVNTVITSGNLTELEQSSLEYQLIFFCACLPHVQTWQGQCCAMLLRQ